LSAVGPKYAYALTANRALHKILQRSMA